MSNQDFPTAELQPPTLAVISVEAHLVARELLSLCQAVYNDPNAMIVMEGQTSVEKRIHHRHIPKMTLQTVLSEVTCIPDDEDNLPEPTTPTDQKTLYSQLGIIDQDGAAFINVSHRTLPFIDIRDPFTAYIMSCFRSHLAADSLHTHD